MRLKRNGWTRLTALLLMACSAVAALAQDWPTYGGDNARSGHVAPPTALMGPGQSFLRWWRPHVADLAGQTFVIDNLAMLINGVTSQAGFVGTWNAPTSVANEAENPFIPSTYVNADPATSPSYRYAFTTPSINFANPQTPQIAGQHRTATWTFDFNAFGEPLPRSYALYVWLPIGSTLEPPNVFYQQRYWVYEIQYGSGQRYIDVVDVYAAGTSWVRLGGGGFGTTQTFPYDGSNPIRVILHNTVPRNDSEALTDTPGTTLVYADAAMAVPDIGYYRASPIVSAFGAGGPANTHTVAALNRVSVGTREGRPTTITKGELISYVFDSNTGANNTRWVYTPQAESENVTLMDNLAAGVAVGAGWTAQTLPNNFFGTNYHSAAITTTAGTETAMTYSPTLEDGSYEIWAWLPGSSGGVNYGHAVTYIVQEGATNTTLTVNQDTSRGWVKLGNRRYAHDATNGDPLRVQVTNLSIDGADLGRQSYADAIRFVGATNLAINSTPVQVDALVRLTPGGPLVTRSVTLAAAENGRIYCLDSQGNGDGTTKCYWTYPSTPDPNNSSWTDPNQVSGVDGNGPIAEMPTGFDLSSALVQRINGEDYLFIGSSNGRVYCISMAGRGDMNDTLQIPGTTARVWSYPDDYPSRRLTSNLGAIQGSLVYADNADGPTIFVPTTQGRMYALDAVGNAATKTTTVRWRYPLQNQPTLGPIVSTPSLAFNRIYFGTQVGTGSSGRFFALNIDNGSVVWEFNGTTLWGATPELQRADDFNSGPVTIPSTEMSGMPDTVVVANDNRWVTALNADTGAVLWTTDELGGTVIGNLSFTWQTVYNNGGALAPAPVVVVPVQDGRLLSLFAEDFRVNSFGGNSRLAWGFATAGTLTAQAAIGRNWMYAADESGYIYAFNDTAGTISPGNPPGQTVIPPNDPAGIPFRESQIRFVTKDTYDRLRQQSGSAGHLTYAQATAAARAVTRTGFEWGETVYALVFNFPYEVDSNPIPPGVPPQVNYRFNVEGASVRNITVTAKQFASPGSAPTSGTTGEQLDGYAITSFTIQGSGSTALPPGNALATFSISAQFGPGEPVREVIVNPANTRRPFAIANPLAVGVAFDSAGVPLSNYRIGWTSDPDDAEAAVNGSPDVSTTPKHENLLLSSVGMVAHGQQGTALLKVADRSMMTLIRGPGRGLDQVRAVRSELAWNGGAAAVLKPLNQVAYPNTEQLPIEFPNNSLDYPNLSREYISVVKDKFGNVENPLYGGVSLTPPNNVDVNNPLTRVLVGTPVDIEIDVPKYQPPNSTLVQDSAPGVNTVPSGYYGQLHFFVDSSGNGQLDRRGRREAFRSLWLGANVAVDERIVIDTPVVDLGSLAQGAGYSPLAPGFGGSFSPWTANPYQGFFKEFVLRNEGNVNLVNLRPAKMTNQGAAYTSWGLFAPANHERSWLDTRFSMWMDFDSTFALDYGGGWRFAAAQKSRVGDRSGSVFTPNMIRRENPFLNVNQGPVLAGGPEPANPRVAVTVPIGTPVGTYITTIRVIEDSVGSDQSMAIDNTGNSLEPYSDPTLTLRFNVREGRITNGNTRGTAPMVHGTLTGAEPFLYKNVQPTGFRDLAGQFVVSYASNAAAFNDPQPAEAMLADKYRLYFASLNGTAPAADPVGNPLRDLLGWSPGGARWFNQAFGPYPTTNPDSLFGVGAGESILPDSVRYGAPTFPLLGRINPFTGTEAAGAYVAFLGNAQRQTPTGRLGEARIMLGRVVVDASGAITMQGDTVANDRRPWVMPHDPTMSKGRPAIVQADTQATIFYAGAGTGANAMYYTHFDGANYSVPAQLPLGSGFENFGTPSVNGRIYQGETVPGLTAGTPILELTFSGKLRNRPHSEIYFARLRANASASPVNVPGSRTPLVYLPRRNQERLAGTGDGTTFQADGLIWNTSDSANNPITLQQRRGATITNLEIANTRTVDRTTGLISFDTRLGGKAYLDPEMGTVRFAGTVPARDATILLSYTPRILRISTSGGSAYTGPSGIFDDRLIGEFGYWANRLNVAIDPNDQVRSGRYVFTYSRAAAGAGSAARPYMRTMRLGVQLPTAIHTQPGGNVTSIVVNGMANTPTSFYQVDPANGRVYFTGENENRTVSIAFTGIDETTGAPIVFPATDYQVGLISERGESPVAIEQPVNDSQLFSFIDPMDGQNAVDRRAGLIWMVWTSTRAGGPDVYIQSIAPRFTPVTATKG